MIRTAVPAHGAPDKRDGVAAPDGLESGAGYLLLVTPTVVK